MAFDVLFKPGVRGRLALASLCLVMLVPQGVADARPGTRARARAGAPARLSYPELVDRVIALDSESWVIKTYQRGSVRDVAARKGEQPGNILVVASYGYTSGARATVTVLIHNGRVECVEYSDDPWSCHPVGNNPGLDIYANVATTRQEREREAEAKAYAQQRECDADPRYC